MLRNLQELENCSIGATEGEVGHVKDFYFDDHSWAIRYLIVDTGSWLFSRKVLVSPISVQKIDWAAKSLHVAISRSQIENCPDIDTEKPVSRQHEEQYFGYYGYPYYWGGAGMWGAGMYPYAMIPGYDNVRGGLAARDMAIEAIQRSEYSKDHDYDPHLRSCRTVAGYHVHASDGDVGHVEGFLIDDETWAIRFLVVNTSNWWLGHKVLIAPLWIGSVNWAEDTVSVDLTRAAVKSSPVYDPSAELDIQRETDLYRHYGRMPNEKYVATPEHTI